MTAFQLAQQLLRAAKRMKGARTVTGSSTKATNDLYIRVHAEDGAIYDVTITTYKEANS